MRVAGVAFDDCDTHRRVRNRQVVAEGSGGRGGRGGGDGMVVVAAVMAVVVAAVMAAVVVAVMVTQARVTMRALGP